MLSGHSGSMWRHQKVAIFQLLRNITRNYYHKYYQKLLREIVLEILSEIIIRTSIRNILEICNFPFLEKSFLNSDNKSLNYYQKFLSTITSWNIIRNLAVIFQFLMNIIIIIVITSTLSGNVINYHQYSVGGKQQFSNYHKAPFCTHN